MLTNVWITIGIVALLMYLDFFLTLKGFSMRGEYAKKVRLESYELNPLFKKDVQKMRYNWMHLVSVIMISVLVYLIYFLGGVISNYYGFYFLQGMLIGMFVQLNVQHIQNIMIFNSVNKNPELIKGKLEQTLEYSLRVGAYISIGMFSMLFIVFLFTPNFFTAGFAAGPLVLAFKQWLWLKKAKKRKR